MADPAQRVPRSIALRIYLFAAALAGPVARWVLQRRNAAGKEDPARRAERLGEASQPRPEGALVWFHAASVGESVSLLGLIEDLLARRDGVSVLLTTGTRTSAELMARRLPEGALHQFVPMDFGPAVRRFLTHWRRRDLQTCPLRCCPPESMPTYRSGCARGRPSTSPGPAENEMPCSKVVSPGVKPRPRTSMRTGGVRMAGV